MRIWRSLDAVPGGLGPTVVTVGNFDGVHRGHQFVVRRARSVAAEAALGAVVAVTFDPHPMAVLRPDHAPAALTSLEERAELLHDAGVDAVLALPFTREMAAWSPERFIQEVLVDALHAEVVVVGSNFRFGAKAAGDVDLLARIGARDGFRAVALDLDGEQEAWSSTAVRRRLAAGDVEGAATVLGRWHAVRGVVVAGDRRGRALGYPTANVPTGEMTAAPADGVYAGWLRRLDGDHPRMPAAISVGTNPTFEGVADRRVESYVLDRDDLELYGVKVEVTFVARLRGMARFDSVGALVRAMGDDARRAHEVLGVADAP